MSKPKVSIIIPVHNTKKYLKKCLDSILGQTLKNVEVIVVDDASIEDIESLIVNEYEHDDRIIFIRNETIQKPGGARNRGLEIAQGDYVSFCDSDDWLDLNLYETAIKYMDDYNADIGMYSMLREYDVNYQQQYKCQYKHPYLLTADLGIRILSGQYNMGISISPACINKIYRKSFLDKISASFEENVYFQGLMFTIYTFLRTQRIICIPNVNYHHYKRQNSVVQSFNQDHIKDFGICFETIREYLCHMNYEEKYKYNFYKLCESYMDLIISEIFEFINDEEEKKKNLRQLIKTFKQIIETDDYFEYCTAEELRLHIQPHIINPNSLLK